MAHNILYEIDRAIKKNKSPTDIEKLCSSYLNKFPKNKRISMILTNLKKNKILCEFETQKQTIKDHCKQNNLEKAYSLTIDLLNQNKNDPETYALLGDISFKLNNHLKALGFYKRSYELDKNFERLNSKLYNFLMKIEPQFFFNEWEEGFSKILSNKKNLGHTKLFHIANKALKYFKLNPAFRKLIQAANIVYKNPNSFLNFNHKGIKDIEINVYLLSKSELFLLGINENVIADIEIEKFLTFIRRFILFKIDDFQYLNKIRPLIECIALNSFFNDYIFYVNEDETRVLSNIKKKICLRDEHEDEFNLVVDQFLCLGMYQNLRNLLLSNKIDISKFPKKYLKLCITNSSEEHKIIEGVKSFGKSNYNTSVKVKEQYETFPYPN